VATCRRLVGPEVSDIALLQFGNNQLETEAVQPYAICWKRLNLIKI
jgi:hypothetical protein